MLLPADREVVGPDPAALSLPRYELDDGTERGPSKQLSLVIDAGSPGELASRHAASRGGLRSAVAVALAVSQPVVRSETARRRAITRAVREVTPYHGTRKT